MNADYTYCVGGTCLHRLGCKRFTGNYPKEQVVKLAERNRLSVIMLKDCIDSDYKLIDRFRLSDGTEMEK